MMAMLKKEKEKEKKKKKKKQKQKQKRDSYVIAMFKKIKKKKCNGYYRCLWCGFRSFLAQHFTVRFN